MPMQGMQMNGMPMQGMPQISAMDHMQQLGTQNMDNLGSVGFDGFNQNIPQMYGGSNKKLDVNNTFFSDDNETEINEVDPLGFYTNHSEKDIMNKKDNFFFRNQKK